MAVLYCSLGLLLLETVSSLLDLNLYVNISDIAEKAKVKYKCITLAFLWPLLLSGQKVAAYVLPLGQRGMSSSLSLSLSPPSICVAPTFSVLGSFGLNGGMIRRRDLRTLNRLCELGSMALWCPTTHIHTYWEFLCLATFHLWIRVDSLCVVFVIALLYLKGLWIVIIFLFENPREPGPFCGDRRISGLGPEERSARQVLNLVHTGWTCCRNYCWNWWIVDIVESGCLGLNHVRRKSSSHTLAEVSLASLAGPHRMGKLHCTHTDTMSAALHAGWQVGVPCQSLAGTRGAFKMLQIGCKLFV